MEWKMKWCSFVLCIGIASHLILDAHGAGNIQNNKRMPTNPTSRNRGPSSPPVKLVITKNKVVMDNGIVRLTFSNPRGYLNVIQYKGGRDNLLESFHSKEGQRGYWDVVWSKDDHGSGDTSSSGLEGSTFKVIGQDDNKVEISFSKTWNPKAKRGDFPLNHDKRFILLRGSSGFYTYAILEHLAGCPAVRMDHARIVFKLNQKLFNYMAIWNNEQRIMPSDADFEAGKTLAYKEAKLLLNPSNPSLKGQVEDKYEYSMDDKDNYVHGWVSTKLGTGFWVITPSDEFRSGGPIKADLSSHVGPTSLAMFFSDHYAGEDMSIRLNYGEAWKKVFGPVFIYLNSNGDTKTLWKDARRQMKEETKKWPYDFLLSKDFPQAGQRGTITGRLRVHDGNTTSHAKSAYIGLALPGVAGSWQRDSKGYQFWTRTNHRGFFSIPNIRPGIYNLYGWVPGVIGDYKYESNIKIQPGKINNFGDLVFNPPRSGPTIWEIGIPDRTAAEFFVPDPAPGLSNSLFNNHVEKWRQYGLWDRYTDLYPNGDLVYTIGKNNFQNDWFFAHVDRKVGNKYVPTTWQIKFNLANVKGVYTLRIALASTAYAQLQVKVNDPNRPQPLFSSKNYNSGGRDNAIARHGIHGLYWLYQINIPASNLVNGINTIFLKQQTSGSPYDGAMYDYIRLEGPSP